MKMLGLTNRTHETLPFPSHRYLFVFSQSKQSINQSKQPTHPFGKNKRLVPCRVSQAIASRENNGKTVKEKKKPSTLRHLLPSTQPSHLFQRTLYSYRCICIRASSYPFVRNFPSHPSQLPSTRRSDSLSKIVSILLLSYAFGARKPLVGWSGRISLRTAWASYCSYSCFVSLLSSARHASPASLPCEALVE
jgi:hypothetical protein